MQNYTIERLDIEDYEKCNNIWDMLLVNLQNNRFFYIYKIDGEFYKLMKNL